jgi:threonine dehydratase
VTLEDRESLPNTSPADVYAAYGLIAGHVRRTPLEHSPRLSLVAGASVYLKLECWQATRSFKVRGAFHAIATLSEAARNRGLVAASAGNHGQAVALAAHTFGIPATIFLPASAPQTKKARILAFGATLSDEAADYDEAERMAAAHAEQHGMTLVHAFADPAVIAGQGTVAVELLEQRPDVNEVIVPVGGGGLIAGMAMALKHVRPGVRVIGVQSSETPVMYESLRAGRVLELPVTPTLADGLAGGISEVTLALVREHVDDVRLVDESALPAAIRNLFSHEGVIAEGAAATAAAAVETLELELRGPVILVITGGNIDAARLGRLLLAH